jgi:hypothetical protein
MHLVIGLGCSFGGVQRIRARMVQVECYQSESLVPESSSTLGATCVITVKSIERNTNALN